MVPSPSKAMTIFSSNCMGLGQARAVLVLAEFVKTHRPDFILLYETLVHMNKVESLCLHLGYSGCFNVDSIGRSRGIGVSGKMIDVLHYVLFLKTMKI